MKMDSTEMYTTNSAQHTITNYNHTEVKIPASDLVEELTDTMAEQVAGGAIITPVTRGGTNNSFPAVGVNNNIPSAADPGVGLTPFYPALPATKLKRLAPLDPSTGTAPRNGINITIPLPLLPPLPGS